MKTQWAWAVGLCALMVVCTAASGATVQQKKDVIDAGIDWLLTQRNTDGSWYGDRGYTAEGTGAVVLTLAEEELERQAMGAGDAGEHNAEIRSGLKWLLENSSTRGLGIQPAGNPDVNGNNRGIYWTNQAEYVSGFTVPAVVKAAEALGMTTVPGDFGKYAGEPISRVVQDCVDYLAFAQNESGIWRGGWRYGPNYSSSDNSVSQFPALALLYAQAAGATVPTWVKDELRIWVTTVANADGGSDYVPGDGSFAHGDWLGRAGGMIVENVLIGGRDAEIAQSLAFINTHWQHTLNLPAPMAGNSPYTLWALYKGCEVAIGIYENGPISNLRWNYPHSGGNFDDENHTTWNWWEDYCEYLVLMQQGDGRWTQTAGTNHIEHENVVTSIGVNILRGLEVPPPPPIPEPLTVLGAGLGIAAVGRYVRRRRMA